MMIRTLCLFIILCLSGCQSHSPRFDIQFISKACITPYHNYHYLTCDPILVWINEDLVIVPAGFDTDLASIPRIVWPVISPMNAKLVRPAILHDWLYRMTESYSRKECDIIFYDSLRLEGIGVWRASMMYYAVRAGGWVFYRSK